MIYIRTWLVRLPLKVKQRMTLQVTDYLSKTYGTCREKTCLRGFRQSETQTSPISYRDKLVN